MIVASGLREVIILSDPTHEGSVLIDAPVHSVFDYCLDPRRIFAGDPMKVVDATLIPEGVGTTAHLTDRMLIFVQDVPIEYIEVVPDQRIVFEGDWRMTIMGLGIGFSAGIHSWTWSFASEDEGDTADHESRRAQVSTVAAGPRPSGGEELLKADP